MRRIVIIAAALLVAAAPLAAAQGPADESDWGRCQAYYASETGNEEADGAVRNSPAFNDTSESSCSGEDPPWTGTPGEEYADEHAGEDPGKNAQDPGSQGDDPQNETGDRPDNHTGGNGTGNQSLFLPGDEPVRDAAAAADLGARLLA